MHNFTYLEYTLLVIILILFIVIYFISHIFIQRKAMCHLLSVKGGVTIKLSDDYVKNLSQN